MAHDSNHMDFNRSRQDTDRCLANIRHFLRVNGDVYHKHLQARLALLEHQLSEDTVPHEIYRAQGRVKELKSLIEDLFPHNKA